MNLMPSKVPLKFRAFHTLEDALPWLDLSHRRQEVFEFWEASKSLKL